MRRWRRVALAATVAVGAVVAAVPATGRPLAADTVWPGPSAPTEVAVDDRRAGDPAMGETPQSTPGGAAIPTAARGTHRWPVAGVLVTGWDPPRSPYGPGHRGVDLAVAPGERVRATADGVVAFAGPVAGRAWVSVEHAWGIRTTVGPLAVVAVTAGDRVTTTTVVGTAAGTAHADQHEAMTGRLHVSARVADTYVDPTPLVGAWVATLLAST